MHVKGMMPFKLSRGWKGDVMAVLGQFAPEVRNAPVLGTSADTATSSTNAAGTITYAAVATKRHSISGVAWSYSGALTGGKITVKDGSTTIFEIDITASGPGSVQFPRPKAGSINTDMTITIAAGGSGVVGKVNALNYCEC